MATAGTTARTGPERKRDFTAGTWNKGNSSSSVATTKSHSQYYSRTARPSYRKLSGFDHSRIAHYSVYYGDTQSQIGAALFKDSSKSQRPSKRARQRIKKKQEGSKYGQTRLPQDALKRHTSESGYDTTGDAQTPVTGSPVKAPLGSTENNAKPHVSKPDPPAQTSSQQSSDTPAPAAFKSRRTDSNSSSVSLTITDASLRKQMKDLQRCEKCITKYEAALHQNCEVGMKLVKEVFSAVREGITLREEDLVNDIVSIRNTASRILQRRKETASYLKKAVESSSTLEAVQIEELKQQIKQFVTDRKVDEEIGTIKRFEADQDDIIPQIMGFGKVNDVRHLYTAWEEDPGAMIEMSKYRNPSLASLPPTLPRPRELSSPAGEPPSQLYSEDTIADDSVTSNFEQLQQDSAFLESSEELVKVEELNEVAGKDDLKEEQEEVASLQASSSSSSINSSADSAHNTTATVISDPTLQEERVESLNEELTIQETSTEEAPAKCGSPSVPADITAAREEEPTTKPANPTSNTDPAPSSSETRGQDKEKDLPKHSPTTRLHSIVLLKPPKIVRDNPHELSMKDSDKDSGKGSLRYSPEQLAVIQSRVRESLQQQGVLLYDPVTGARPVKYQTADDPSERFEREPIARKKKTPTQLRRERKKRQRERERRQKELEDKIRRESSVPKVSPDVEACASSSTTSSSCSLKSATYSSSESPTPQQSSQQEELTSSSDELQKPKRKHKIKQVERQEDTDDTVDSESDNMEDTSSDNQQQASFTDSATENTAEVADDDKEKAGNSVEDSPAQAESNPVGSTDTQSFAKDEVLSRADEEKEEEEEDAPLISRPAHPPTPPRSLQDNTPCCAPTTPEHNVTDLAQQQQQQQPQNADCSSKSENDCEHSTQSTHNQDSNTTTPSGEESQLDSNNLQISSISMATDCIHSNDSLNTSTSAGEDSAAFSDSECQHRQTTPPEATPPEATTSGKPRPDHQLPVTREE